eukprot:TRINITY_DN27757_c0_g1_i1.p1 TRINITY_DN27757_c0_g1~~TRINITY_DN27757_c0_g1_i1.p1  ORF type:complete len:468 (+),score=144.84 TRINITY_DN27757_c0_g1_i1:59-1462(+)
MPRAGTCMADTVRLQGSGSKHKHEVTRGGDTVGPIGPVKTAEGEQYWAVRWGKADVFPQVCVAPSKQAVKGGDANWEVLPVKAGAVVEKMFGSFHKIKAEGAFQGMTYVFDVKVGEWVNVIVDESGNIQAVFGADGTPSVHDTTDPDRYQTDLDKMAKEAYDFVAGPEHRAAGGRALLKQVAAAIVKAGYSVERAVNALLNAQGPPEVAGDGSPPVAEVAGDEEREGAGVKRKRDADDAGEADDRAALRRRVKLENSTKLAPPDTTEARALFKDVKELMLTCPARDRPAMAAELRHQAMHVHILALYLQALGDVEGRPLLKLLCLPDGLEVVHDDTIALAGTAVRVAGASTTQMCFFEAKAYGRASGQEPALICTCERHTTGGGAKLGQLLKLIGDRVGVHGEGERDVRQKLLTLLFVAGQVVLEHAAPMRTKKLSESAVDDGSLQRFRDEQEQRVLQSQYEAADSV